MLSRNRKKLLQMKTRLLVLLLLFFTALAANAQLEVRGKVFSANKTPLAGAAVVVKGTKIATQTDAQGAYSIKAPNATAVIVFNYVGMETKEFPAGSVPAMVVLGDNANALNDVVVIGYGTQKRKDITGSVATAPISDMLKAPVASFDQALAGRIAGVQVTASDGQPGAAINITIRGANSVSQSNAPLYVIDGFPVESPDNNTINPDDIESIDILKDASATAIYGARGANGVIIITTKRGKLGSPVVTYNGYYGSQRNIKTMPMMSAYDFVKYQIELNPSTTPPAAGGVMPPTLFYLSGGTTMDYYRDSAEATDYQSEIFRTAPVINNSISVTGGNAQTKYAISGNIFNQQGIVINSGYKRYQGRAVLDQVINKKLKVGINANYSYLTQSGQIINGSNYSATLNTMYSVWGFRPVNPSAASLAANGGAKNILTDESLTDPTVPSTNDYRINPVKNLNNTFSQNITKDLVANAYLEYSILPNLSLKITGGIENRTVINQRFYNSQTAYGSGISNTQGVNGSVIYNDFSSWLNENYLTYNKTFKGKHTLNVMAGMTSQQVNTSSYGSAAILVPNEALGINALSQGTPQSIASTASYNTTVSFLGRVNYAYSSKYLFTLSYRADGSSKFSPQNHWAYFPAGAIAWKFTQERFMDKLKNIISEGKLRVSYGVNGNNRVSDFAYLPVYNQSPGNLGYGQNTYTSLNVYSFNNNLISGAVPATIGNQNLKWETTGLLNLGVDLGFLKNRINLTADVYDKKTSNLLLNAAIPTSSGYSVVYKNIGSVRNRGLELTLNTTNIQSKKFNWTTSFNIAFNKNKVLSLSEGQESLISTVGWDTRFTATPAYIAKVGQQLGLMYGLINDGVYHYDDFEKTTAGTYILKNNVTTNGNARNNIQPGDIKYRDINGDGVIDANDYTVIGHSLPKHTGGFTNNFTYKNFDLSIFFQWSYGNDIQNANNIIFNGNVGGSAYTNQFASYTNRWSSANPNSDMVRAGGYTGSYTGYSTYTVEDGSYLRLKTVSFGYNLPASVLKQLKIAKLRAFASVQNLVTWTKYSGQDPEVNTYNSVLTGGFDYSSYPKARTITLGLNVTF